MELDRFMPEHDFRSVYSRRIAADPATAWRAFQELTAEELHITQMLTGIRSLGTLRLSGRVSETAPVPLLARDELAEVRGKIAKFWYVRPEVAPIPDGDPAAFRDFTEPGWAKTVTGARVVADGDGSLMTIETRVRCTDERSRLIFGAYWLAIRAGGAGLVRLEMLQAVARRVEPVVAAA
ncbi:hypothetical protein [Streptomyces buecherae]|uniref:DUF2867 domain-containing protein n=1 Tax=Streptomyces buecherae TaxID=2763006 RepID=A0A7H8N5E8_9ACTN|nr:hypothetical protein [Streptomyces buecherae]QKW49546.1 hypothetical protein HUT08_08230 [Streptomyces buecherae]